MARFRPLSKKAQDRYNFYHGKMSLTTRPLPDRARMTSAFEKKWVLKVPSGQSKQFVSFSYLTNWHSEDQQPKQPFGRLDSLPV